MTKLSHSKFRNTGVLFEVLARTITADTLAGKDSPALNILKKHFINTELGKEYKLYDLLMKKKQLSEGKANLVINTILETYSGLNKTLLKKQRYNLIKEIKDHYNLDEFFKTKVNDYKTLASLCVLLENKGTMSADQVVNYKSTLLEHLVASTVEKKLTEAPIVEDYKEQDRDVRLLAYKLYLEKFNSKYENLSDNQKSVLKEFINSVDSSPKLRDFYNTKITEIKADLKASFKKVKEPTIKIKLEEVSKLLAPLDKNYKVKSTNLVDLLQYYELVDELKSVHA